MPQKSKVKKIKIRVTDIVARPQPGRRKKGAEKEKIEPEKLIEIEIPEDASVEKPAIISVDKEPKTREDLLKEAVISEHTPREIKEWEKKVQSFEKSEIERFEEEEKSRKRKKIAFKSYILIAFLFLILGTGIYSAIEFLPRVKVKITTRKTDWHFVDSVTASKRETGIDAGTRTIPAEIFIKRSNGTFPFPATGRRQVEKKAGGTITIYNAYSSESQPLVATTRFATSDGKIFRLEKNITVPGAKIVEGKIVPSAIEAKVYADKAGPEYNIGPVDKFTIPGFQGTPKYAGFYAKSNEAMSGGFIGQLSYPTSQDIEKGRAEALKQLVDGARSFLYFDIQPSFKTIDGGEQFVVLSEKVNEEVDGKGNFAVFLDAEMSIVAFRESDVMALMSVLANNQLKSQASVGAPDFEIKDFLLNYGTGRTDFKQGQISFALNFSGTLAQPIDVSDFTDKILKKKEADLRNLIYSLPDVERTTISFWPFWVKTVPDNPNRVTIEVK